MKENVSKNHGVVVNFQTFHSNYYDVYGYVTKEDPDYVTSQYHQLLINSPQTQKASRKRKTLSTEEPNTQPTKSKQKKREKSLDVIQMYDIVTTNNIRIENQLFSLALPQKEEGKTDLLTFVLKCTDKRRQEIICTPWRVVNVNNEMARKKLSNMEILEGAKNASCVWSGE